MDIWYVDKDFYVDHVVVFYEPSEPSKPYFAKIFSNKELAEEAIKHYSIDYPKIPLKYIATMEIDFYNTLVPIPQRINIVRHMEYNDVKADI